MTQEQNDAIIKYLKEELDDISIDSEIYFDGEDRSLRLILGIADGEELLTELFIKVLNEDTYSLVFAAALCQEMQEDVIKQTESAVSELNLRLPAGAYIMYRPERSLIYHYEILFDEAETEEELALKVLTLMEVMIGYWNENIDVPLSLARGELTYAQLHSQGLC